MQGLPNGWPWGAAKLEGNASPLCKLIQQTIVTTQPWIAFRRHERRLLARPLRIRAPQDVAVLADVSWGDIRHDACFHAHSTCRSIPGGYQRSTSRRRGDPCHGCGLLYARIYTQIRAGVHLEVIRVRGSGRHTFVHVRLCVRRSESWAGRGASGGQRLPPPTPLPYALRTRWPGKWEAWRGGVVGEVLFG